MNDVLTPPRSVDLLELSADLVDAMDRLYTMEERLVRLTAQVEAFRKEEQLRQEQEQLRQEQEKVRQEQHGAPSSTHVHGIGDVGPGPWSPYLDSIRDIGPLRQRQTALLPGLWTPYGLTASDIVADLNERYPDKPMRPPNVYPLLKSMIGHGLLVETPGTKPIRYTVNRRSP